MEVPLVQPYVVASGILSYMYVKVVKSFDQNSGYYVIAALANPSDGEPI